MRAVLAHLLLVAACSSGPGGGFGSGACAYPSGPYGTDVGDVVDPSLSWKGFVDSGSAPTTVSITDYYDCDGSKGVQALLLDESASWCGDCVAEAEQIGPLLGTTWKNDGVRVVTLVAQDAQTAPGTLDAALSWRDHFALSTGAVCADPGWTMRRWGPAAHGAGDNGFPTNALVDPRTMKIVAIQPTDLRGTVENLAGANR